jgi:hypothetical protein
MATTAGQQKSLKYKVQPLLKEGGESDADAVRKLLVANRAEGWEVVDSCGDEIRMPVLIFRKAASDMVPEYRVEEIPHARKQDELQAVSDRLWSLRDEGWICQCVLDSPISVPVGIFSQSTQPLTDKQIKVIIVTAGMFEKTINTIVEELLDQQVKDNLGLQCVMHGGLNPVLIMMTKDSTNPFEYLVEHAKGGIFSNQSRKLTELIESRAAEGWDVCGAFEDSFMFPCVIFRRETTSMPVTLMEFSQAPDQETLQEAQEIVVRDQEKEDS